MNNNNKLSKQKKMKKLIATLNKLNNNNKKLSKQKKMKTQITIKQTIKVKSILLV